MSLRVRFTKGKDESEEIFRNREQKLSSKDKIDEVISQAVAEILRHFEQWTQRGSEWQLD